MHVYGYLPIYQSVTILILFSLYMALYFGGFGALSVWLGQKPWQLILIAPAAWVALELIRATLFTGFPWELLGYSQYRYLWVVQAADLAGVYGLSALIVVVNVVLMLVVLHWLEKPWRQEPVSRRLLVRSAVVASVLVVMVLGYGIIRIKQIGKATAAAEKAKIAVIQGNIDQASKWDPSFQMLTAVKYRKLSLEPTVSASDLIVWPETATPFYFLHDELLSRLVTDGIKKTNTYFIVGSPSFEKETGTNDIRYFNSAYLIAPTGEPAGRYDKVHLVPFGEYVPLQQFLPFIEKLVAQVGDFETGRRGSTLAWRQHKIGMLICYEVIFADLARAMTKNGAHLLVNITNDAWFGRTSAAYQHFSMAVFRAIENRRPLARAANTGISGFIDPCGRILATTDLYVDAAATADVALLSRKTVYTRFGDLPPALLAFGIPAIIALSRLRRRRQRAKSH